MIKRLLQCSQRCSRWSNTAKIKSSCNPAPPRLARYGKAAFRTFETTCDSSIPESPTNNNHLSRMLLLLRERLSWYCWYIKFWSVSLWFYGLYVQLSYDPALAESVAVSRIAYANNEVEKKKGPRADVVQFTDIKLFFTILGRLIIKLFPEVLLFFFAFPLVHRASVFSISSTSSCDYIRHFWLWIRKYTWFPLRIRIPAIHIRITRATGPKGKSVPLAEFELKKLEFLMTSKTFGSEIGVYLGGLALCASTHTAPGYPAGQLFLIKTPMTEGHLFKLKMLSVSFRSLSHFSRFPHIFLESKWK
jgi:hypothetical protein